jgi:hypothetical protein
MTAVSRDRHGTRRTNSSCSESIRVSILFCSASYAVLSSLLEVGTDVITGKLASGADLSVAAPGVRTKFKSDDSDPVRGVSNACLDSVATLATATSAPGPLMLPGNRSLCRCRQYKGLQNDDTVRNLPE